MSENVTPKQTKAILALLTGTVSDAAEAAGVTDRTVFRWLKEDSFRQTLAEAEALALAEAARIAAGGVSKTISRLLKIIDLATDDKDAIAAARVFLSTLPNIRVLGSLETRLVELEENR